MVLDMSIKSLATIVSFSKMLVSHLVSIDPVRKSHKDSIESNEVLEDPSISYVLRIMVWS